MATPFDLIVLEVRQQILCISRDAFSYRLRELFLYGVLQFSYIVAGLQKANHIPVTPKSDALAAGAGHAHVVDPVDDQMVGVKGSLDGVKTVAGDG